VGSLGPGLRRVFAHTRGFTADTDLLAWLGAIASHAGGPFLAAADASAEFRSFVANAKISGVFQGAPARAMINGRLVRTGETVDAALGILFAGVDPVKRHLLFKDKAGTLVARKY
jgi:hypothetical protein